MTSQGQRFRRRALRRGYKVDEVDSFLDRVEATLAGEPQDAPVTAQEVHDVVFRVKFGGYDEWQVDLHLDRVERQLAESGPPAALAFGRSPEPSGRMAPPDRMGPLDRMGPPVGAGHAPGPGAVTGFGPSPQPGGPAAVPHQAGPGLAGPGPGGPGGPGPGGPPMGGPAPGGPPPGGGPMAPLPPLPTRQPQHPAPAGYREAPEPEFGPYEEPTYGGYDGHPPPGRRGPERPEFGDMTSEMRFRDPGGPPPPPDPGMPDPGFGPAGPPDPGFGPAGPPGPAGFPPPGMAAPPGSPPPPPPPMSGYAAAAPPAAGYSNAASGDLQRLDELRRTFQPRRFGSGYDRAQVDRLFEEVMAGMSGHGPMSVSESELDPRRFDLVPGGYFEAEVDAALHELRDILRHH